MEKTQTKPQGKMIGITVSNRVPTKKPVDFREEMSWKKRRK